VVKERLDPPEEIHILTDTCLFCAPGAIATLEGGEEVSLVAPKTEITSAVQDLRALERMCFYEMDSIVRLTDVINSMRAGNRAFK
jgi:hypothetical protein